jgi:hypothetical protein
MDRRQLFRQYDLFNQYTFLDYLKQIKKRLGKVILFTDRAQDSINQKEGTKEYLKENNDSIKIFYLPKGSPEFNAVVENAGDKESTICWFQNIIQDLLI